MRIPADDAWKQVTLKKIERDGLGFWLYCQCGYNVTIEPSAEQAQASRKVNSV